MNKALILHGTAGSPESNWFMWLKKELSNAGYTVWLPQLPNAETPNTAIYNKFLLNNPNFRIDEHTTIIGHSSGAVEALSILQHLAEGVRVNNVFLVSAFKDSLGWDALEGLFAEPYNYELIKTKASSITLIHSDNDPYVSLDHAEFLSEQLDARLVVIPNQGHFNTEQSKAYKEFPELLRIITSMRRDP